MTPLGSNLFIGLMCGTSVDSVDAALVNYGGPTPSLIATHSGNLERSLRNAILSLCQPSDNEIEKLGVIDRQVGELFANTALTLLDKAGVSASDVAAIGSHGQTVRHRPPTKERSASNAFTLQLGDPNTIAQLTGITTVGDFRRRDIAAGGQGAPLVPLFHRAVFGQTSRNIIVVNIGGMANITVLAANGDLSGFDTGPGNTLMDAWTDKHQGKAYDTDGTWGRSGNAEPELVERLLAHPFIGQPAPKSTGREDFNLAWLEGQLATFGSDISSGDVQASLVAFTAASIASGIEQSGLTPDEVLVCGGGSANTYLMECLQQRLPCEVSTTDKVGLAPDWVEAAAFAWLARQTLLGLPGNAPSVTGASEALVLGGIYPA